jgi:hypothetical protein
MTEDELSRTAATLGDRVVQSLDEQRLARAVLARLAEEPSDTGPATPRVRRGWLLGLAAAAAMLLVARLTLTRSAGSIAGPEAPVPTLTVLHELDDLSAAELEVLLETLPPPAGAAVHPDPASFDDLDAKGLERLLRSLEG